jgi:hypothetical protein
VEEEKALKEPEAAMPISTEEETKRKVAEDKLHQEAEVAKPQIAEKEELWNQQEAKKMAEEKTWQEVATRKIAEEDAEKLAESRVASMLSENWRKKRREVTPGRGRGSKIGRRKGSPRGRGSETFTTRRREATERRENWQKKRIASKLIETGREKIGSRKGSSIRKIWQKKRLGKM